MKDSFPSIVPLTWLEGKTEGDVITIEGDDITFKLTCNQKDYHYPHFGTFEQAVNIIVNGHSVFQ